MKNYYFTFGGFNAPELRNFCVKIEAEHSMKARELMFSYFGPRWGFMYKEEPYEKEINLNVAMNISKQYYDSL